MVQNYGVLMRKMIIDSWDRTSVEKGHLYFCKSYLGVNRNATNIACRTEMGHFPLKFNIDIHNFKLLD